MLLLRLKRLLSEQRNSTKFLTQLCGISVCVHILMLSFLMFKYDQRVISLLHLQGGLANRQIPIVILPFAKTVPGALQTIAQSSSISARKQAFSVSAESKTSLVEHTVKKTQKIKKPQMIKKSNPQPKKIAEKKLLEKKKNKKTIKEEPKVTQQKPQAKIAQTAKPQESPKKIEDQAITQPQNIDSNIVSKNNNPGSIVIGQYDLQLLHLQEEIEKGLSGLWRGPSVSPTGQPCILSCCVDNAGKVQNIQITQSSKSLAYDISVRNVITAYVFPQMCRNQTLTLSIK